MKEDRIPNEERQILIVDDEPQNLELLELILLPEKFQIHKANNGQQAVDFVLKNPPDLVLMDVCMPIKTGFEACKEIKTTLKDAFVPVTLLTNLHDEESKVRGLDAGADEYLVKPPKRAELLARVRAMLRIRDLQHRLLQSAIELKEAKDEAEKTKKIIEEEIKKVGSIQQSFLPSKFPSHPDFDFAHYYEPCADAGGDYFDLIEIGHSRWGLLIADVTGHGASAAVVMAITHTLMHSFISTFHYPSTALKVANEKLNEHLAPTFYVTMFYGVLNFETKSFRFSSAGHEPMMIYRAESNTVELLKTKFGFPLKLMESDDYDECEIALEPDDKLVLFTDGLVEIRNPEGEILSPERLRSLLLQHHDLPPKEFIKTIIDFAKDFRGNKPFQDDVTMLVIQRKNHDNHS
jgi:sigma-B regulation protein RsbU (phosphoserine phosphatase)